MGDLWAATLEEKEHVSGSGNQIKLEVGWWCWGIRKVSFSLDVNETYLNPADRICKSRLTNCQQHRIVMVLQ